jgi:hypothetical protein
MGSPLLDPILVAAFMPALLLRIALCAAPPGAGLRGNAQQPAQAAQKPAEARPQALARRLLPMK